jgi:hypothetical protein
LLLVKIDLSFLQPGKYFFGIRRASRDWTYYPVEVV